MQRTYEGINGKTVVKLEDVELVYNSEIGTVTALAQVNLDIQEGEFICVMGPSGCGKSTLLNIIAGFMQPTDGQALMNGKPIEGPDWQRGVVFQSPPLYPWLTIKENVNFGLRMRNIPEKEREAITEEYLEIVGLQDFANRKPYELSGGMKQRASLAKVLVNEPGMILMDEPFGALDALTRDKMQALIRRIWMKNQSTVFFITHDVDEALSLGDESHRHVQPPRPHREGARHRLHLRHGRRQQRKRPLLQAIHDDARIDPERHQPKRRAGCVGWMV